METKEDEAATGTSDSRPAKVFVITRRFENQPVMNTKSYPIADVASSSITNPNFADLDGLAALLLRKLNLGKVGEYTGKAELTDFCDSNIDTNENLSDQENDWTSLKQRFIEKCFENLSEKTVKFHSEFVSNIHELQHNNETGNQDTNIFIYHHWLDKQGIGIRPIEFLPKLRKEVEKIIQSKNITQVEFNWLVHDTDILDEHDDGLLWFDDFSDTNKKISYHLTKKNTELENTIPNQLQKDNIWCFVHQKEIDSYYKNIIIEKMEGEKPYKNAEELYNELIFDKKKAKIRVKLINRLPGNYNEFTEEEISYILDLPPLRGKETINSNALRAKITFLNKAFSGLVTENNSKYCIDYSLL
jgi:hypothetical protein